MNRVFASCTSKDWSPTLVNGKTVKTDPVKCCNPFLAFLRLLVHLLSWCKSPSVLQSSDKVDSDSLAWFLNVSVGAHALGTVFLSCSLMSLEVFSCFHVAQDLIEAIPWIRCGHFHIRDYLSSHFSLFNYLCRFVLGHVNSLCEKHPPLKDIWSTLDKYTFLKYSPFFFL